MLSFEQIPLPSCPRPGYPRPDFRRPLWQNLNGEWEFEEDPARSGVPRGLHHADHALTDHITVPFCRESVLSGLGHLDFCDAVWYRKEITVDPAWRQDGRRVILHIGACDFKTEVWVNGTSVGLPHTGGMNAFSYDITDALREDEQQIITICATDLTRSGNQTCGKQSQQYASYSCLYTRTTGIWQTVWLESVPAAYIRSTRHFPSIHDSKLTIEAKIVGGDGLVLRAEAFYEGRAVGAAAATVVGNHAVLELKLDELHLWEIGKGRLYDLTLTLQGEEEDVVDSYFGMREIAWRDGVLYLNGKAVFQRLILDQGFYPDGIWTAPTDEELKADIDRSMAMGFHGARLHQKVFEPRFLYECDKAGYIVWGEHGNWGMDITRPTAYAAIFPDWIEILERDFNHPAIIGWCPLNETDGRQIPEFLVHLAALTRAIDPTRPYIETSGYVHVPQITDFLDSHFYEQDPAALAARLDPLKEGKDIDVYPWPNGIKGKPTFISEYGGIRWTLEEKTGWGYGDAPKTLEELVARFCALTEVIMQNPKLSGLCYTQLTDVELELNGLYTYDRVQKFDPAPFKAVLSKKAAIEE